MTPVARLPWRKVAAALPAVAMIGGGAALAATGGSPVTDIVAESRPLVTVPEAPLTRLDAPVLPALPALPAPSSVLPSNELPTAYRPGSIPDSLRSNGIPAPALAAYRRAAALVNAADAACKIDWALIAAIGKVESNHGRYAGNGLDQSGTVRPGIFGIPLNGSNNTAVIKDTDGGAFDRDSAWDRAVGPMQFIPGTWRSVGVDADGDGVKNPQNMSDAATATAVYLCSGPGDLTTPSDLRSAILRYNHSDAYVRQVVSIADAYRGGFTVLPSEGLSDSQRNGDPYLPSGETSTMASYDPARASSPAPKPARPADRPKSKPATQPAKDGGASGSGSGSNDDGGAATPQPAGTPGVLDPVTDIVDSVTKPLTGGSTPTPSPSPTPTPTPTTEPPLTVPLLQGGTCPSGYQVRLSALGIPLVCERV
jgi:membrane-bound lytic murein transglycosylase B